MNNFEKIKNLTLDEMAEFSSIFQRCCFCIASSKEAGMTVTDGAICRTLTCKEGIKQWLQAESEG